MREHNEFKFRLWDTEKNVLKIPVTLYEMLRLINEAGFQNYKVQSEQTMGIVMQYTGLKDKNHKEIYEGDIVKGIRNGIELVEMFQEYNIIGYNVDWEKAEIIGNIYENPELLNENSNE